MRELPGKPGSFFYLTTRILLFFHNLFEYDVKSSFSFIYLCRFMSIHKFLKSAEVTFFEGLYRDYFTRTLFFAQQYLPDPEEAREIAQETFVTLWEKRTEIRPDLSVQAFILTIAKHKCLNVLRKKIAEQKYSDNLTARETMANYSALSDETFDTVQMQELEQLIGQALSELPEKTRIIYKMSRDQEMTYEEIAQEIDLSVKSVEYHMTKALAHMRHKLKDYLILLCFGLIPLLT